MPALASIVPNTPTSPLVPIPPPEALHFKPKRQVETGPKIALEIISGSIIAGFFIMLGIWSMLVPIPCETSPETPFSLKEATAKPIIWQLHPTTAAPPAMSIASSVIPLATDSQIAADEVGIVRRTPITTEIIIPMKKGVISVALDMSAPSLVIRKING